MVGFDTPGRTSPTSSSATRFEVTPDDRSVQLSNLRDWVCELLIKNQQLRMALLEMKSARRVERPTTDSDSALRIFHGGETTHD
jgi:hypothetical protein